MAEHELQALGYRLTPQRQLVWDTLRRSGPHVTAEEICADVQRTIPSFNMASVYRTLELLERIGLVRASNLGEGRRTYELSEPNAGGHHHLVCDRCHTTIHFGPEPVAGLRHALERDYGFQFDDLDLVVFGLCPNCAGTPRSTKNAS
ncbi:MAG: transcriptional repressor [Chloroflexi bacterium]|nr:transcriptional repressor [Chloroflexota bacterium]